MIGSYLILMTLFQLQRLWRFNNFACVISYLFYCNFVEHVVHLKCVSYISTFLYVFSIVDFLAEG